MIKLEHVVLASYEQMEFIIEGMRNAKNSWEKSDSGSCGEPHHIGCEHCPDYGTTCDHGKLDDHVFKLGNNDKKLTMSLSIAGEEHRKYMRMMPVYVRITAPLYWWKEFDTYKVGTVSNSCSTMHKIQDKEFTLENFSCEHLEDCILVVNNENINISMDILNQTIRTLNFFRTWFLELAKVDEEAWNNSPKAKALKDGSLSEAKKKIWWQMIQLLPSTYNQTRNIMMNYEVLAKIYKSRKNHKLDEWREFCKWIETLPYSELVTLNVENEEVAE